MSNGKLINMLSLILISYRLVRDNTGNLIRWLTGHNQLDDGKEMHANPKKLSQAISQNDITIRASGTSQFNNRMIHHKRLKIKWGVGENFHKIFYVLDQLRQIWNKIIHDVPWLKMFVTCHFHPWLHHICRSLANHPTYGKLLLSTVSHHILYYNV